MKAPDEGHGQPPSVVAGWPRGIVPISRPLSMPDPKTRCKRVLFSDLRSAAPSSWRSLALVASRDTVFARLWVRRDVAAVMAW